MLLAGKVATARQIPVVLDPVGAGATEYRTTTARSILELVEVTVLRGNAGEIATLVGAQAEVRGVESIGAGLEPAELAHTAARALGVVATRRRATQASFPIADASRHDHLHGPSGDDPRSGTLTPAEIS